MDNSSNTLKRILVFKNLISIKYSEAEKMSMISLTIEPKILFSYPSAKDFTSILNTLAEIVDETLINVTQSGIEVKALDPARVSMLIVKLPPEAFQDFKVDSEIRIGLAVSNLVKILKNLKKSDRIVIGANEEFVEIVIEGTTIRRYKFKNIEVISEEVPELSPQFDVEATVLSSPLRTALNELSSICSTIGISAKQDMITLFDYDNKRSQYRLTTSAGNIVSLSIKTETTAAYDSEYLAKILNILRLSNIAELKYGSNAPLYLSVEFSGGRAEYYLASKI